MRFFSVGVLISVFFLFVNLAAYSLSASFPKADSVITAQLQALIVSEPDLASLPITVSTKASVVSLSGQVAKADQANRLVMLAYSIAGVQSVDASGLKVLESPKNKEGQTSAQESLFDADSVLTSLVLGLFQREGLTGAYAPSGVSIQVHTKDGVVSLSGTVDRDSTARQAERLAGSVQGVVRVESRLTTGGS